MSDVHDNSALPAAAATSDSSDGTRADDALDVQLQVHHQQGCLDDVQAIADGYGDNQVADEAEAACAERAGEPHTKRRRLSARGELYDDGLQVACIVQAGATDGPNGDLRLPWHQWEPIDGVPGSATRAAPRCAGCAR